MDSTKKKPPPPVMRRAKSIETIEVTRRYSCGEVGGAATQSVTPSSLRAENRRSKALSEDGDTEASRPGALDNNIADFLKRDGGKPSPRPAPRPRHRKTSAPEGEDVSPGNAKLTMKEKLAKRRSGADFNASAPTSPLGPPPDADVTAPTLSLQPPADSAVTAVQPPPATHNPTAAKLPTPPTRSEQTVAVLVSDPDGVDPDDLPPPPPEDVMEAMAAAPVALEAAAPASPRRKPPPRAPPRGPPAAVAREAPAEAPPTTCAPPPPTRKAPPTTAPPQHPPDSAETTVPTSNKPISTVPNKMPPPQSPPPQGPPAPTPAPPIEPQPIDTPASPAPTSVPKIGPPTSMPLVGPSTLPPDIPKQAIRRPSRPESMMRGSHDDRAPPMPAQKEESPKPERKLPTPPSRTDSKTTVAASGAVARKRPTRAPPVGRSPRASPRGSPKSSPRSARRLPPVPTMPPPPGPPPPVRAVTSQSGPATDSVVADDAVAQGVAEPDSVQTEGGAAHQVGVHRTVSLPIMASEHTNVCPACGATPCCCSDDDSSGTDDNADSGSESDGSATSAASSPEMSTDPPPQSQRLSQPYVSPSEVLSAILARPLSHHRYENTDVQSGNPEYAESIPAHSVDSDGNGASVPQYDELDDPATESAYAVPDELRGGRSTSASDSESSCASPSSSETRSRASTSSLLAKNDAKAAKITDQDKVFSSLGSLSAATIAGWFRKLPPEGKMGKTRLRYFVFRGGTVSYYVDDGGNSRGRSRKGHIGITAHSQALCEGTRLKIINLDRVWHLSCDSEVQVGEWGEALAREIARKRANLGTSRGSGEIQRSMSISVSTAARPAKGKPSRTPSPTKANAKAAPRFDKSLIGAPIAASFQHVSHLGLDSNSMSVSAASPLPKVATPVCGRLVPYAFRVCIEFLCTPDALREQGLFRVSGNKRLIDDFVYKLEENEEIDLASTHDPATACGLLKQLIKKTQMPLSSAQSKSLQNAVFENEDEGLYPKLVLLSNLHTFFQTMPPVNVLVMQSLLRMFGRIVKTQGNSMTFSNLGIAVGPTLFPSVPIQRTSQLLEMLNDNFSNIWPDIVLDGADHKDCVDNSPVRNF